MILYVIEYSRGLMVVLAESTTATTISGICILSPHCALYTVLGTMRANGGPLEKLAEQVATSKLLD